MTIPHYKTWADVPDLQDLATKSQLGRLGYKPLGDPVATVTYRPGKPPAALYRRSESMPKKGQVGLRPSLAFSEAEGVRLQVAPNSIEAAQLHIHMQDFTVMMHEGGRYLVARMLEEGVYLLQPLDVRPIRQTSRPSGNGTGTCSIC